MNHLRIFAKTIPLLLFTSITSSFAQTEPEPTLQIQVAVVGADAERLMDKIMEMPGARILENTIHLTTWQYEHITCTLWGAHAGSPDYENPYYRCSLSL